MYDVEKLRREEFGSLGEVAYLNNASIAPLPLRTRRAVELSTREMSERPWPYLTNECVPYYEGLPTQIAEFINAASPQEITLIGSTSFGLNSIAQGLRWTPGDNLCLADVEFPSNVYPWMNLAEYGVETRLVHSDLGGLTVAALADHIDDRTRLVSVSAVQFFTGHRADLAALGALCRERDILFVVDAIQAIGHLPLDVQALGIDALVTGGQKSLLSAPGTGFLYIRQELAETMQPRYLAGNSTVNFRHWLDYNVTPLPGAARFANGTFNIIGFAGLGASLDLLEELGRPAIDAHTQGLVREAAEALEGLGFEVITPIGAHGPILSVRTGLDEAGTDAFIAYLQEQGIIALKHLGRDGTPHMRLSFHAYNTRAEVARLAEVMEGFLVAAGPDW